MAPQRTFLSSCPFSCSHQGTCFLEDGKSMCLCRAGFVGEYCEQVVKETTTVVVETVSGAGFAEVFLAIFFFVILCGLVVAGYYVGKSRGLFGFGDGTTDKSDGANGAQIRY